MNIKEMSLEQVRQYIGKLAPDEQAHLMLELERGILLGDDMPNVYMVIDELRQEIRKAGLRPQRIGNPSRWFFRPFEPFLLDGAPERKRRGYIARASLTPIWLWICRDLMPVEAKAYSDKAARVLLANDMIECQKLTRAFQDQVLPLIQLALADHRGQQNAHRRLAAYTGSARATDDLQDILGVLRARDALAALGLRLPIKIANLDGEQLDHVMTFLNPLIKADGDIFLYALIVMMGRLEAHWQLIRLGIKAAQSKVAAHVEKTPYAVAVTLVLGEIDHMIAARQAKLAIGETVEAGDLAKRIDEAVEAVRTEMDLSNDSPWAGRLAAI